MKAKRSFLFDWPFLISAVVLAVSVRAATSATLPAPPCTCPDTRDSLVDPFCMATLNKNAKAGVLKTVDDITAGVLTCLGFNSSTMPVIRILSRDFSTPAWDERAYLSVSLLPYIKALSGLDVVVDLLPATQVLYRAMDTVTIARGYYSLWFLGPFMTVDLASQGRLEPLDQYVLTESTLDWLDIHKFFRSNVLYNGSITGIPVSARNVLLYYRKDILSAANLSVPATWDDLLYVARTLNGTDYNTDGQPEYAMCLMVTGSYCDGADVEGLVGMVLASYTQSKPLIVHGSLAQGYVEREASSLDRAFTTECLVWPQGTTSGWLFDPDTLQHFVNTEAMEKTLRILSRMVTYSWPSSTCEGLSPHLWSGRCAITITNDASFREIQTKRFPNPYRGKGKMVVGMLPGSHQVLDRATGRLVPCANTTQCPHATYQYSMALNDTVLVNKAPLCTGQGAAMINADCPAKFKALAVQINTVMSNPETALTRAFAMEGPNAPYRYKQLATDAKSLAAWAAYGCNTSDVKDYLTLIRAIYDHPNIAGEVRVLNAYLYRDFLVTAGYMIANFTPPDTIQDWLTASFDRVIKTVPLRQFAESLWAGLNIPRTWQEPSPPPQGPMPVPATRLPDRPSGSTLSAGVILAIVLPVAASVVLVGLLVLWAVKRGWVRLGQSGPPKAGPLTTLVVTDVEESTQLWETLPMHAMDETIRLHHGLIRKLLAKHHGYESATEGDAFIMAFHTPGQAMDFSYALQQQLLEQPWPAEILQHNITKPVWARSLAQTDQSMPASRAASHAAIRALSSQDISLVERGVSTAGSKAKLSLPTKSSHVTPRLMLDRSWLSAGDDAKVALSAYKRRWAVMLNADSDQEVEQENSHLAYRGLRLRLGLHTGVGEEDVVVNKTNGGLQYTGQSLLTAKSVADSGQGGMIVMTLATFKAWKHEWMGSKNIRKTDEEDHDAPLVLHLGSFVFKKAPELEAVEVYSAVVRGLECRLAVGGTSLRNAEQVAAGVLQAPVGSASVAFCTMVGYSTLLAWNKTLALDALATFNTKAMELLMSPGGAASSATGASPHYLLELADGLCLTVFGCASSAIVWGLHMVEQLKQVEWPEELLAHELCESVGVAMASSATEPGGQVAMLFHGPRIKVGIDSGDLTCDVSPATARMAYRGRPMNRAARVVDKVPSGQVWITEATHTLAMQGAGSSAIQARDMGTYPMKGLTQALKLFQCAFDHGKESLQPIPPTASRELPVVDASDCANPGSPTRTSRQGPGAVDTTWGDDEPRSSHMRVTPRPGTVYRLMPAAQPSLRMVRAVSSISPSSPPENTEF